jgi:hypothetical protein
MTPATRRGFAVRCLLCGHPEVLVSLADVNRFHCAECDEDFTAADVKHFIDHWGAVLAWASTAPVFSGPGADSSTDAPAGR